MPPVEEAAAAVVETPVVNEPVVVTPPAAPVQVALETPKVETPPAAPVVVEGDIITYEPTGDAGLDVALDFIGRLGIAGTHPAMVAAEQGNFDLLAAHLATLGDKARGWEAMLNLGKNAHANITKTAQDQATAVSAAVVEVAGGADQWAEVNVWASANADASEKAAINAMFSAGPIQARAAAKMLVEAYQTAKGTVVNPASATVTKPSASPAATTTGPLDRKQYSQAVQELSRKLGGRLDESTEYRELQARRQAYRGN